MQPTPDTTPPDVDARGRGVRWCAIAYGVALAVAFATALVIDSPDPQWRTLWADVAATVAIFAFSVIFRNSSFYDPYWSVAPIAIVGIWLLLGLGVADPARSLLATASVCLWGARLTFNFLRGWTGLDHEDWRYRDMRERCGAFYWPVSFAGIHMMPTLIVFLGCLPLYPALVTSGRPFGWVDALATIVVATAIWWEAEADNQLRRFRLSKPPSGSTLRSGLWSLSRHPNYFGEILFWWGIFLFGLGAAPDEWWRIAGAVAITLLFRFVSLRLIDDRMRERRPDYDAHVADLPALLPWPRRRSH